MVSRGFVMYNLVLCCPGNRALQRAIFSVIVLVLQLDRYDYNIFSPSCSSIVPIILFSPYSLMISLRFSPCLWTWTFLAKFIVRYSLKLTAIVMKFPLTSSMNPIWLAWEYPSEKKWLRASGFTFPSPVSVNEVWGNVFGRFNGTVIRGITVPPYQVSKISLRTYMLNYVFNDIRIWFNSRCCRWWFLAVYIVLGIILLYFFCPFGAAPMVKLLYCCLRNRLFAFMMKFYWRIPFRFQGMRGSLVRLPKRLTKDGSRRRWSRKRQIFYRYRILDSIFVFDYYVRLKFDNPRASEIYEN